MNTLQMRNGAVVVANDSRPDKPQMFDRGAALALAEQAGPDWTIEIMRTAPRYYVVLASSRPNEALTLHNRI